MSRGARDDGNTASIGRAWPAPDTLSSAQSHASEIRQSRTGRVFGSAYFTVAGNVTTSSLRTLMPVPVESGTKCIGTR